MIGPFRKNELGAMNFLLKQEDVVPAVLAKKMKINRSTALSVLERLIGKTIVEDFWKNEKRKYRLTEYGRHIARKHKILAIARGESEDCE